MAEGYVIIKHQVFGEITDAEVIEQLPKSATTPIYKIFDIKREIIPMENVHQLDSVEYRIYQKNIIDNEIKPFIEQHPDYKIMYFGTATIPLALHLGYCFGSWKDVGVYLLHREKVTWDWSNDDEKKQLPVVTDFVGEEFTGPIDVIYKVETTYNILEDELKTVVENPNKIISLRVELIGKDIFRNQVQLGAFAHQFALGLDSIANYLPGTDKIHLFPTVPVGLAFLMGTKINPLITKPIVTYQFNTNRTPKHEKILILQEMVQPEANITVEDQKFIDEIKNINSELENKIAAFVKNKIDDKKKYTTSLSWIKTVLPDGSYTEIERGFWKPLPAISETILNSSTLSKDTNLATDGFFITENNEWQISDRFIFNIINRLDRDKAKILRALRLFIFHEALHIHQVLTNYTAFNIGRFPRVLEEADYIADVWAMIHEYSYSKMHYSEANNEKEFFKEMIDVASKTMWAFDDLDPNTEEMQIRRVNRYLIWFWNYLQIEDRNCQNLEQIISFLANKPLLEIRGLDIRAQSQRTIFRLTGFKTEELEIGYLDASGKIRRTSNAAGFRLDEVVRGFRERNEEKILSQLKSWYHQLRN